MASVSDLMAKNGADASALVKQMGKLESSLKGIGERLQAVAEGVGAALGGSLAALGDQATASALQVDGAMVQIQSSVGAGASSVEAFGGAFGNAFSQACAAVASLGDGLSLLGSKAMAGIQSFIDSLLDLERGLASLPPAIEAAVATVTALGQSVDQSSGDAIQAVSTYGEFVAGVEAMGKSIQGVVDLGDSMGEAFALWRGGAGSFSEALALIVDPTALVVAGIAALIAIFIYLWNTNEDFRNAVIAIWQAIVTAGQEIWDTLSAALADIWNSICQVAMVIFGELQAFWADWGGTIMAVASAIWEQIKLTITTAINLIKDVIGLVLAIIRGDWGEAWDRIKSIGATVWNWIEGAVQNLAQVLAGVWNAILTTALNIWKGLANGVIGFVNRIIDAINGMVRALNKIHFDIPDWVPGLGGKSFGFNLPLLAHIPLLAAGGIAIRPTLAMIGEGGRREAVIPLPSGVRDLSDLGGGGPVTVVVELDGHTLARATLPEMVPLIRLKTGLRV